MISHIFILNTTALPTDDGTILSLLTKERRERVSRIIPTEKKRECIGAELLLWFALRGKYSFPLLLSYSEKGKPYIEGSNVKFSLSHSGGICVCAVAECELGVDIEKERDLPDSLKKRFLTDCDALETPCLVWSAKEAFLKLTGDGIDGTIKLTDIETKEGRAQYGDTYAYLYQQMLGEFVVSVCAFSPLETTLHEATIDEVLSALG